MTQQDAPIPNGRPPDGWLGPSHEPALCPRGLDGTQPGSGESSGRPAHALPGGSPPRIWAPPELASQNWGPPTGSLTGWGPPTGARYPDQMREGWAPGQWAPPHKPSALPTAPRDYPWFWRSAGVPRWKPVVAVLAGIAGFFLLSLVVGGIGVAVEAASSKRDLFVVVEELGSGTLTPVMFLANSISLGFLIPLSFLLSRIVGQRGGWLSSVVGRVRWTWLMKCLAVSLVAVGALVLIPISIQGWDQQGLALRPGWWWLLIGVIVVTPFQAAGEEYIIRGVLNRAVASLIPARIVGAVAGAVLSSVVFATIHFAEDTWLNITYFSLGMLLSYLAWRTGGLEAAIAMHTANNIVVLVFLPFQDISEVFDRAEGASDPTALIQLAVLGAAAAIIVAMARRGAISRTGPPARA